MIVLDWLLEEGLLAHERAPGGTAASIVARRRGEEYLLERQLLRRKTTGEVVDPAWLQFSFPMRWHYDVLRALEYFRSVGAVPDPRMNEAIEPESRFTPRSHPRALVTAEAPSPVRAPSRITFTALTRSGSQKTAMAGFWPRA